jgi:hypothetical protein
LIFVDRRRPLEAIGYQSAKNYLVSAETKVITKAQKWNSHG